MTEIKTPRGHYLSERKGLIKLSSMNPYHLKRALIKRQRDLLGDIYNPDESSEEFLLKLRSISRDRILNSLKREIKKR
jgi:hypothetical protein